MAHQSRRYFIRTLGAAGPLCSSTPALPAGAVQGARAFPCQETVSLGGAWQFRIDSQDPAESTEVTVPHTWQITPALSGYMGVAWYRRSFEAPEKWADAAVRIEFEAVFHSATVWVNDILAGRHTGKGYTAFAFDITRLVRFGKQNILTVRVDNSFSEKMLPRGQSSDWAHDGGIYRPVHLLITPKAFIDRVDVDAIPTSDGSVATLEIAVAVRNTGPGLVEGSIGYRVVEESTGQTVLRRQRAATVRLKPGASTTASLPAAGLERPKLWHFDHPHLYRLIAEFGGHTFSTTFGVRAIEVKNGGLYLNGERVFLMGTERMAGSNPDYGMAEPLRWLIHDHDDLKELNCVFTRVHWQQDRRVLDYCDRHGILIQVEVPTWGRRTFRGMGREPSPEIMQNGLEQLREMIHRDRNHPSIFAWGLCNEIGGQSPAAFEFARRMYEEAKRLDPRRLRSYASNSLQKTPERDVAGLMDFIEWNEYYESWFQGTADDLRRNLEEIHRAFPEKMIVISEYGYCACTPDRPEGDSRRIEILKDHDKVFREHSYVGGLIFFCYNDYRTHVGDKGRGVLKQRVHGVVDVYGARKPSFDELRRQSSPVAALETRGGAGSLTAVVRTREQIPAYTLDGYRLRWIVYSTAGIPLEQHVAALPRLEPGQEASVPLRFEEKSPARVSIDVVRPTGFSVKSAVWKA